MFGVVFGSSAVGGQSCGINIPVMLNGQLLISLVSPRLFKWPDL